MNRQIEMEYVIKYLEKIRKEINQDITKDTVYFYLTRGLINNEDCGKLNDLFPEFINYFKNKKNICVFNSDNWKYFCQFLNINDSKQSPLFNPIKIYLSVSKSNIKEVTIKLFDFLEKNNICHKSKIGSDVRTDDIVLRIYSKKDEEKIYNFINNSEIKEKLMKPNPFCFQKDNIGYAMDGKLSYNYILSKYLKNYINNSFNYNKHISLDGFIRFVTNINNKLFNDKEFIDEYIKEYIDDNDLKIYTKEEVLNNYAEITRLLIISMQENNYDYFLQMVNNFNNHNLVDQNIEYFKTTIEDDLNKKVIYLNKAILETYKKYNISQVYSALRNLLINYNFRGFTNNNQARNNLIMNLSLADIKKIINLYSKDDYQDYINKVINDKMMKTNDSIELKVSCLDKAIKETYFKYGINQAYNAIYYAINDNDFGYFTNNNNSRSNLKKILTNYDINNIMNIYANGDIVQYVNGCVNHIRENNSKSK